MRQATLFQDENPDYLSKQLITYIGNKRNLLDFIGGGIIAVQKRLQKQKLAIADFFSGSGIVARYCKQFANRLVVNDLEKYSETVNRCYLSNQSELPVMKLRELHADLVGRLENHPLREGFIYDLYAPKNGEEIQPGERVFYTPRNAKYLDTARQLIDETAEDYADFFTAPLLSEASVHANTAGVFKGFYKDRETGTGRYGGSNGDALERILGEIVLPFPVFSRYDCEVEIMREDAETAALNKKAAGLDVAYLDPPYNQHPYGSNYFMLNLIAEYKRPREISPVSGIPADWNRSIFNKRKGAAEAFADLTEKIDAKFLLVSFNSEGFIPMEEMKTILRKIGKVEILETKYNTFRGSRNLRNRDIHVTEYLYLVEKR